MNNRINAEEQLPLALDEAVSQWRGEITDAGATGEQDLQTRCKSLLILLTERFEQLKSAGADARAAILSDDALPADFLSPYELTGEPARYYAAQAITEWYFADGQEPTETTVHMAAIGCSDHALTVLQILNDAKEAFQSVVGDLRANLASDRDERDELYRLLTFALGRRPKILKDSYVGDMIRDILHPRLSLRQAVRRLGLIDPMPASIRWRWVEERASDRVTRDEIMAMLDKRPDTGLGRDDRRRVMALPPDEILSITKKRTNQLRVAITFPKNNRPNGAYRYLKNRLPVFYRGPDASDTRSKPKLTRVSDDAPIYERRKRLETEPFLATLSVYRYRSIEDAEAGQRNVSSGDGGVVWR